MQHSKINWAFTTDIINRKYSLVNNLTFNTIKKIKIKVQTVILNDNYKPDHFPTFITIL